jgi:hypothetical protein
VRSPTRRKFFTTLGWAPEILVCNDVGAPEIADFFALSETTKKIVMIHAKKASEGSKLSASSFHEVCSQAVRYLGFFNPTRRRIISTAVKLAVWKRDVGKCVKCGATDELHFDHDLPWSKGGTSLTEANVQLLCTRHNLEKRDHIL